MFSPRSLSSLARRISSLRFLKDPTTKLPYPSRSFSVASSSSAVSEVSSGEVVSPVFPVPDPELAEVIQAVPRCGDGKIIAKRERKAGRVPGVVYSLEDGDHGGHKELISVETKQISRLLKRIGYSFFLSRTFVLEVRPDLESDVIISRERVLPRWVHLHAGTDAILNATFIRAPPEAVIKVDVPIVFRGEDACPGIRKGGYLNTIKRTVRLKCPADLIPPYVEINLGDLQIREKVLLRDLKVHPSINLVTVDDSLPVCKIMGTRFVEGPRPGASSS